MAAERIHRIETDFGGRTNAVYLLVGERTMLVDTTTANTARHVAARIAELGVSELDYVVSTHADWDHVAGNGTIRTEFPGAKFVCHRADRAQIQDVELMIRERYGEFAQVHGFDESDESKTTIRVGSAPARVDIALDGDASFSLADGWEVSVIHTPGHSRGSVSVHDPDTGIIIIGDAVLGSAVPMANGDPAFPPTYRYVDDYLSSIRRLRALEPTAVHTSHYPVMEGAEGLAFLDESELFVSRVDREVTQTLRAERTPLTLVTICERISSSLGDWPTAAGVALVYPVLGHMERLVAAGAVAESVADHGLTAYRWVSTADV